ncbi:MAG: FKBP-type peptidyl-prolyl cis-trans isomerase [Cellvibrionaceae bacterium]
MTTFFQARKMILGSLASAALLAGSLQTMAEQELDTLTDRVSYIVGYNLGSRFSQSGMELNTEALVAAIEAASEGKEPVLSQAEMQQAMQSFQEMQQAKMAEIQKAMAAQNTQAGADFLAANAKKDGVKTTASGLQYKVITEGSGEKPTLQDSVSAHYRGTLIDGTEFDSSYARGKPATFGVTHVIPGWTEALQMMPEGSKWEIYIPSDLAYGPGGSGAKIGPNATLIFEIELLKAKVQ